MKAFFFILIIFLLGCEVIVDIKIPEEKPKLTLNSFFNPDSLWRAELTLNRHILNRKNFQRIDDALLVVYEGENPVDTLISKGDGIYQSDSGKPIIGKNYHLRAISDDFGEVLARSHTPVPAEILKVAIRSTSDPLNGSGNNSIKIKFKDEAGVKNYYQVFVETESEYIDFDTHDIVKTKYHIVKTRYQIHVKSNDPAIQNSNFNWDDGVLIKDTFFDGKETELSFRDPHDGRALSAPFMIVTLRTLSEGYFKYITTSQLQTKTSEDPLAQPVNVYNNVENGYGIFAGYSQSVFIKSDPRPVVFSFSPLKGKPGDHVIISGENFGMPPNNFAQVTLNGSPFLSHASVVTSNENQIEAIIPPDAITGKIYVYIHGRVAISDEDLEIIN